MENIDENVKVTRELIQEVEILKPELAEKLKYELLYLECIPKYLEASKKFIEGMVKLAQDPMTDKFEVDRKKEGLNALLDKTISHWNAEVDNIAIKVNRWRSEVSSLN